jgi:hypothetical protein
MERLAMKVMVDVLAFIFNVTVQTLIILFILFLIRIRRYLSTPSRGLLIIRCLKLLLCLLILIIIIFPKIVPLSLGVQLLAAVELVAHALVLDMGELQMGQGVVVPRDRGLVAYQALYPIVVPLDHQGPQNGLGVRNHLDLVVMSGNRHIYDLAGQLDRIIVA